MVNKEYTNRVTVAIVSKYGIEDVYISIKESLKHAGRALSTEVKIAWLDAERYERCHLKDYDGILIPGGFGKRGIEGKIEAIQFARENNVPFLGLCLGFQLATVEFARHKAGIADATSEEFGEGTHVIASASGTGRGQRTRRYDAAWQLHRRYPRRYAGIQTL